MAPELESEPKVRHRIKTLIQMRQITLIQMRNEVSSECFPTAALSSALISLFNSFDESDSGAFLTPGMHEPSTFC